MRKKVIAAVLVLACLLAGCQEPEARTEIPTGSGGVDFYCADSTEKILQEDEDITDVVSEPKIDLLACKGEYENAQIIIHAKQDIGEYDVKVSDLTCGGEIFSAENIYVYHEKYIEVKENYEGNGAPVGMYPDALLPMEKAVEYGENSVKNGNNQGVYISFAVPTEQSAGIYTGKMEVIYDGQTETIPVTLEIADYQLSQTTHIKSKFNVSFYSYLGELDSTQAMLDKYINTLAEYRLSPGTVVMGNDQSVQEHIDKAYELAQNEKMASFALPAPGMTNSQNIYTIDHTVLTTYLKAVVDKCMDTYDTEAQQGFNLAAKADMTCSFIDEFNQNNTANRVPYVLADFHTAVYNTASYILENKNTWIKSGVSGSFIDEVYQSILDFPLILSVPYDEQVVAWDNEAEYKEYGEAVFCPYISDYDTVESRENYNARDQRWAYICNNPKPPYATYHMEDTLLSARALGWQLFEYDIDGLFYWATDLYAEQDIKGYQLLEDYYDTALRYTANGGVGACNGDGFLFYPGAPYGIDGPVVSMRLQSIRDGLEEYELLCALEKRYQELGYSADDIVNDLSALLYTGTKVAAASGRYAEARQMLIHLVEAAYGSYELAITGVHQGETDTEYLISVSKETLVTGENIRETKDGYAVTVSRNDEENPLSFIVASGEQTKEFVFQGGRKTVVYGPEEMSGLLKEKDGKLTAETTEEGVLLNVGAVKDGRQSISLTGKEIASINADTYKLELLFSNPDAAEKHISMYVKFANKSSTEEVKTFTIPASSELDFVFTDFATYNYKQSGDISEICFYLETEKGDYQEKSLLVKKILVTEF